MSPTEQKYNPTPIINEIRDHVAVWRNRPNPNEWQVTPETARLLQHWRHHKFDKFQPFFCQIEAVETAIWLAEVASDRTPAGAKIWKHIRGASEEANPELLRIALKLATGAGKTAVMAMLIAWQAVNAARHQGSNRFSRAFLIVTPGITIKDRLRVLQPNDPDSYYRERELVPSDMLGDIERAKIVIANYHSFRRREELETSKTGRALLQGRGPELNTIETEGKMLQRACGDLMGLKNIVVLNDEAHHCYREKPQADDGEKLKGEEKEEAKKNNEAARLWISGIETVKRNLGIAAVYDMSATPFFLRGSGYPEGTLFPWTVSDFSLMDAIECGIVKLPRVPIADNVISRSELPKFRELWKHVGPKMPKKGRGKSGELDPLSLPAELQTALEALYGHYAKTFALWEEERIDVPPVFIVVCNNTSTSKLVYDFISGFVRESNGRFERGRFELFRNYDEHGQRLARPRTLLIDSTQLESGDALDDNFRKIAADEIERFRSDLRIRKNDLHAGDKLSDQDLLREVMNTVGKAGQLGESIRCVVSVSMLTEGWDANTVTHILGVRAFGTQLLCEQVVGRGLRRQSYRLNEKGLFSPEYADVLGIPFDFTAKPVIAPPTRPQKTVRIEAVSPDRDPLQITFPRVAGYRVELPDERLTAKFTNNSVLELTPELVGPSITKVRGIVGKSVDLTLVHLEDMRRSTILYHLAERLLFTKFRDPNGDPKFYLFGELKRIARQWLDGYLRCTGGTYPAQLMYQEIKDRACERISAAITASMIGEHPVKAVLDPYNPTGSTAYVRFDTSKTLLWETAHHRCHVNWVVCDSDWEAEFCRAVEANPRVRAYVKNQGLGFEVPYLLGAAPKKYLPDFIVRVDDGHGDDDLLNIIIEIKGYRGEDARDKANTMDAYWIPGVNNLDRFGRWTFAEFKESVYAITANFDALIDRAIAGDAA